MPTLSDYQLYFDGLTIGPGTSLEISRITGLDLPQMRSGDVVKPQDEGEFPGLDFLMGRDITIEFDQLGTTAASLEAGHAQVQYSLGKKANELPLYYKLPGQNQRFINCKPRKRSMDIDETWQRGWAKYLVLLHATDPRIYEDSLLSGSTGLASAAGTGLTFNATPDFSFGGALSGGQFIATNAGKFQTPWVATITAVTAITNPKIENITDGKTLGFTGSMAAGDVLILDSAAKTVTLNGAGSRYSWLTTAQWFNLNPGDTTIKFSCSSGTTATLVMYFRSAWI